jgi:hypothetical protein
MLIHASNFFAMAGEDGIAIHMEPYHISVLTEHTRLPQIQIQASEKFTALVRGVREL